MRQDKGYEITILDRQDYIKKCLNMLDLKQLPKLSKDPTNTLVSYLKIKSHLEEKEYNKLQSTGSKLGFFYGTAKLKKLKTGDGLKELPIRSIISDTGTATYKTTKYLKTLLTPLTKSQYNILNTDDFILIKSEKNT